MRIKRWLALLLIALIVSLSLSIPVLADGEGEPPVVEESAPKSEEKPKEQPKPAPAEPPKAEEQPAAQPAQEEKPTEQPKVEDVPIEQPRVEDVPIEQPAQGETPAGEQGGETPTEPTGETGGETPTDPTGETGGETPSEPTGETGGQGGQGDNQPGGQGEAPAQEPSDPTGEQGGQTGEEGDQGQTGEGEDPAQPGEEETPADPEQPVDETPAPELHSFTANSTSAALGETISFSYHTVNAQSVKWRVQRSDGSASESGEAGLDGFSWTPARSGVYTVTVTAVNGEKTVSDSVTVTVRGESLQASVAPGVRYAMVGEKALRYKLSVSGGTEPYACSIVIETKGKPVYTSDAFSDMVSYKPKTSGDHTLKLTVTDASGASVSAQAVIPVATNETNDHLPLPKLRRGMNYAERLVAVAKSQVGYKESEDNFIVDEDSKVQGWCYFGGEYGMPYVEWCAMFVSWSLKKADIPEWMMPRDSNCWQWCKKLGSRYDDKEDEYTPEPGDLIFFHHDREDAHPEDKNFPNHIGIVTGYSGRWKTGTTVEGNVGGKVVEKNYELSDPTIVGYTSMRWVMEQWDPNYKGDMALDKIEGIGFSVAAPKLAAGN